MNVKQVAETILKDMDLKNVKIDVHSFSSYMNSPSFGTNSYTGAAGLCLHPGFENKITNANRQLKSEQIIDMGYEVSAEAIQLHIMLHEIGHANQYCIEYNCDHVAFGEIRDKEMSVLNKTIKDIDIPKNTPEREMAEHLAYYETSIERYAEDFVVKHYKHYYELFIAVPVEEIA